MDLQNLLFPEEGWYSRAKARFTGQGATPDELLGPKGQNTAAYFTGPRDFVPMAEAQKRERAERGKRNAETMLGFTGSIGGVGARHAPTQSLAMAERMDARNSPAERILRTTGWMKEPSGRWMFEIPDHNVNLMSNALDARYNFRLPEGNPTVADILYAPDLFKRYPQLRDIPLEPQGPGTANGSWQYHKPAIALREGMSPDGARNVLLHELAHATQSLENFTNGSSPATYITPADRAFMQAQEKQARVLARDFATLGLNSQDIALMRAYLSGQDNSLRAMETAKAIRQLDPKLYGEFERLMLNDAYIAQQKNAAYERYRNISGEQVAEAVARRADLDPGVYKNRLFFRDFDPPHSSGPSPFSTMEPGPILPFGVSP